MFYISNYEIVEGIYGYVNYIISGELIEDKIIRRFSDFYSLRDQMVKRWPGIYIPNVPPKKAFGNMDKELTEFRMRILSIFCKKVSKYPFLFKSEEMNIFLMNTIEPSKILDNLPDLSISEILLRFNKAFKEESNQKENNLKGFDFKENEEKIKKYSAMVNKLKINMEVRNIVFIFRIS